MHRDARALIGSRTLSKATTNPEIVFEIEAISIHPSYNVENFLLNPAQLVDLAVVRLQTHVLFGVDHDAFPAVIASDLITNNEFLDQTAEIQGWGVTSKTSTIASDALRSIKLSLLGPEYCLGPIDYYQKYNEKQDFHSQYHLCAKMDSSKGPCLYDTGAPLFVEGVERTLNKYIIGVYTSNGPKGECGVQTLPDPLNKAQRNNFHKFASMRAFGAWVQRETGTILPYRYPRNWPLAPTGLIPVTQPVANPLQTAFCSKSTCGGENPSQLCWCDDNCEARGDCCSNKQTRCPKTVDLTASNTCSKPGVCGYKSDECWCDSDCERHADCCLDYNRYCGFRQQGPNSCVGRCGGQGLGCWCDEKCRENGDCCQDYEICSDYFQGTGSCLGLCGTRAKGSSCWCDAACVENGDCCANYFSRCGMEGSCEGHCGRKSGDCWCDPTCILNGRWKDHNFPVFLLTLFLAAQGTVVKTCPSSANTCLTWTPSKRSLPALVANLIFKTPLYY